MFQFVVLDSDDAVSVPATVNIRVDEVPSFAPGNEYQYCSDCPQMVVVPVGEFMMGDLDDSGLSEEKPVHRVTIDRDFAVSKYEITFVQWDTCVAAGDCHRPNDEGWGRGEHPVININWNDITNQYIPWLSRTTAKVYSLLTEAEWEYVARAGTKC